MLEYTMVKQLVDNNNRKPLKVNNIYNRLHINKKNKNRYENEVRCYIFEANIVEKTGFVLMMGLIF